MFETKNIFFNTHRKRYFMTTFTHAGVSRLNGEFKVRFCNDALRQKVLIKNGHKDIDIIELKNPMTKQEAVEFLISIDFATQNGKTNAEVQAALEAALDKRVATPKAAKAPKTKKGPSMDAIKAKAKAVKATKATTVTKAEVTAQLADLEDAPF
jgi:hypothetical protein